ncbi:MAG: carbohydrate porin, partial [Chthoniobacterales bacterium]
MKKLTSLAALLAFAIATAAHAGPAQPTDVTVTEESKFQEWWNGRQFTGDWFGLRDTLEDYGLTFSGKYYGAFFGVIKGGGAKSRGFWDQGLQFGAEQNFGKLFNVDMLSGVKGFGIVRWRDSRADADPNSYVQANSTFNPSNWISGTQWRILNFGLEIGSDDHLSVKDMIVLRGGWLQPQTEFIDQPLSKLFLNNAVNSAKGIGGNIPFSSSFSTWGGTLKVKPVDVWYLKGGLFMAYPQATASSNHGLAMAGYAPDPSQNGLFAIGETGITPKIGPAELPGKYAFGGYYWGLENTSFYGQNYDGQWGLYWQADQMLFREASPAPEPLGKGPSDGKAITSIGKNFKEPVPMVKPALSEQGLYTFNLITFAPKYDNTFPFYFQSGLVYKGLLPGREKDQALISIGFGSYSFDQIESKEDAGVVNQS